MLKIVFILPPVFLLGACSTSFERPDITTPHTEQIMVSGEVVKNKALNVLGAPYLYGGNTTKGFDCSGLVQFAHAQAGIDVPRTTEAQFELGTRVRSTLQVGDVVFFRIDGKSLHSGIYLGNNSFIHAPSSGKKVTVSLLDNPYFEARYIGFRRFH